MRSASCRFNVANVPKIATVAGAHCPKRPWTSRLTLTAIPAVVVRKYKMRDSSCSDLLQFIFVVKTAEYGNRRHTVVIRNVMPFFLEWDLGKWGIRSL